MVVVENERVCGVGSSQSLHNPYYQFGPRYEKRNVDLCPFPQNFIKSLDIQKLVRIVSEY